MSKIKKSPLDLFLEKHRRSCAYFRFSGDWLRPAGSHGHCSCGRDAALKELEELRKQLTIKTLENIKGASVLDDKNAEIARLQRIEAAARFIVINQQNFQPRIDPGNVGKRALDALATTLNESESE